MGHTCLVDSNIDISADRRHYTELTHMYDRNNNLIINSPTRTMIIHVVYMLQNVRVKRFVGC